nr:ribonuclease H [Tanacetum cinerariifolium]
ADNRPPMLEKEMYDSWKSRMELYMLNRPHGRMILESFEQGPLIWPSVEVEGVTRLKKYLELSAAEAIQAECDVKDTNIILQGLPPEISTSPALQDDLILSVIEQLKDDLQKEESRNIDKELALEKEVKELNNIVFKRNQSAQTVHMLTKPQVFYNHATRQALGFQNPRYLKKAQQLKPYLYDGSVIGKSDGIVVPDSENTLMHAEEKSYAEQAFWSQYSVQTDEPTHSGTTIVEVPKELPKVSMVEQGVIKLYFVNNEYQLADLFTKALGRDRIEFLTNKLGMGSFTPKTLKKLRNEDDE